MKLRYLLFGLFALLPFRSELVQVHHEASPDCALQYISESTVPVNHLLQVATCINLTSWARIIGHDFDLQGRLSILAYETPHVPILEWLQSVQRIIYG